MRILLNFLISLGLNDCMHCVSSRSKAKSQRAESEVAFRICNICIHSGVPFTLTVMYIVQGLFEAVPAVIGNLHF